jgi:hypothetical protein
MKLPVVIYRLSGDLLQATFALILTFTVQYVSYEIHISAITVAVLPPGFAGPS